MTSELFSLKDKLAFFPDVGMWFGCGINQKKKFTEVPFEEFNNIIQTNISSLFSLTREVARKMLPRKKGSITIITVFKAKFTHCLTLSVDNGCSIRF